MVKKLAIKQPGFDSPDTHLITIHPLYVEKLVPGGGGSEGSNAEEMSTAISYVPRSTRPSHPSAGKQKSEATLHCGNN